MDLEGSMSQCMYYGDFDEGMVNKILCQDSIVMRPRFSPRSSAFRLNVNTTILQSHVLPFTEHAYQCKLNFQIK